MKRFARLLGRLLPSFAPLWTIPSLPLMAAGSCFGPRPLRMGRPGKSGVPAARRAARKARNRRRHRYGRA